jgi:tetratricopeptide (TPR) repeat protein
MKQETKYPTHLEAKNSLDLCLELFADSKTMNEADIKTAFLGVANSVQIRDYALGAVGFALNDYQDISRFFTLLGAIGGDSAHLEAVWSAFAYEFGNQEEAYAHLNKAKELDPANSLASLLFRVFGAGFPPASLGSMRNELHPKVVEGLADLEGVAVRVVTA